MMYELLIIANDPDVMVNQKGLYRRGDIVAIFPAGHKWGGREGPPKFVTMTAELTERQLDELMRAAKDHRRELYIDLDSTAEVFADRIKTRAV